MKHGKHSKHKLIQALDKANIEYIDLNYQLEVNGRRTWLNRSGKPTIKFKNKQVSYENMGDYVKALQSIENVMQ